MSMEKKKILTAAACTALAAAVGLGVFALNRQSSEVPPFSEPEGFEVPTESVTTDILPENWEELIDLNTSPNGLSGRAESLLKVNKDVVGWLKIDGTVVDYPVVLDPGDVTAEMGYGGDYESNSFYLEHDLYKNYLFQGTLFMDYRDVFGSCEEEQSENIVIHGHNMNNGSMFGALRQYRYDNYTFYDENPFIELSSNYRDYQYIIFGLVVTSGNAGADFPYWEMQELDTEPDFNGYVDTVKSLSMLDTGVDVKYGDKLLTLSTCYLDVDNSRFIVVARRLRDGETAGDVSSIVRTQDYLEAHKTQE